MAVAACAFGADRSDHPEVQEDGMTQSDVAFQRFRDGVTIATMEAAVRSYGKKRDEPLEALGYACWYDRGLPHVPSIEARCLGLLIQERANRVFRDAVNQNIQADQAFMAIRKSKGY
jgi:hypothetical protein